MPRLNDFREMIDSASDTAVLEAGQTLLREMMDIVALKQKLADLESGLTDGGKAIFYFFAEELDEDEIVFAAERITGRLSRLADRENRANRLKNLPNEDSELAATDNAPPDTQSTSGEANLDLGVTRADKL